MKLWQSLIAIVLMTLLVAFSIGTGVAILRQPMPTPKTQEYSEGVNDALMAVAMLNLEQQLEGTNRTYERMFEIVCSRLQVDYRKPREPHWAK